MSIKPKEITAVVVKALLTIIMLLGLAPTSLLAQETDARLHPNGKAWGVYQDKSGNPRLPRVLLIGDSILNGYQGTVKAQLRGKARIDTWVTGIHEGDPKLPEQLRNVLAKGPYDMVHFNIGLHGWPKGRIKDGQYEPLMRNYVKILKEGAPNALLIWASSTPVTVKGKPRELNPEINPTIVQRNAAAAKIMAEHGVQLNDLYTLSVKSLNCAAGDMFHWNGAGQALQGKAVAAAILAHLPKPKLSLASPVDYQVIQRQTPNEGRVKVAGTLNADCNLLEVRFEGKDMNGKPLPNTWTAITPAPDGSFSAELPVSAGGWYTMTVRASKGGNALLEQSIAHVGVGEVFVGAGQSNSTNCGGMGSKSPLDGRTEPSSGLVTTFDGSGWRIANDPQPGTHDKHANGSFWPAFGDAMAARYKVPIGVATTGHGGTSIKAWAVNGGLFKWTLTRMQQLGPKGFRAVLWHQGESDAAMPAEIYANGMSEIIRGFRKAAGWDMPWFVANASFCPNRPINETNSRGGQKLLWQQKVALEGPDTDQMLGDLRDNNGLGIHFSKKGLKVHGEAWAEKVGSWLDQQPGMKTDPPANAVSKSSTAP